MNCVHKSTLTKILQFKNICKPCPLLGMLAMQSQLNFPIMYQNITIIKT